MVYNNLYKYYIFIIYLLQMPPPTSNFKTYKITAKDKNDFNDKDDKNVYFIKEYNYNGYINRVVDTSKYVYKQLGNFNGNGTSTSYIETTQIPEKTLIFEKDTIIISLYPNNEFYVGTLSVESPKVGDLIVLDSDPTFAYYVTEANPNESTIKVSKNNNHSGVLNIATGKLMVGDNKKVEQLLGVKYNKDNKPENVTVTTAEPKKSSMISSVSSLFTSKPKGGKRQTKYNKRKSAKKQTRKHLRRISRR
jgi:hypothetical protein